MAKKKCYCCDVSEKLKKCVCGALFCAAHLPQDQHDHTKIAELKAEQSRIGRSNVRRSKSHERTIAKFLTDWTGQEFRRRRVEGRDVTVIERESTADVIPVKGEIHCSIEAKCGEVQTFANLMANPKTCRFTEWWHQACYDVSLVSEVFQRSFYPMMFFRPYLNQNWVALSAELFTKGLLQPRAKLINRVQSWDFEAAYDEFSFKSQTVGGDQVWFPHFLFDAYRYLGPISFNVVRTKEKANFKYVPLELDPVVLCRWQDFATCVEPRSFFVEK